MLWSHNETCGYVLLFIHSHQWQQAASIISSKSHPVRSTGDHQEAERIDEAPNPANYSALHWPLCRQYIILSNIKWEFHWPLPILPSLFSFPARRRDGSKCQCRDDVSSPPGAAAAGAPYPRPERGPGEGEVQVSCHHSGQNGAVNARSSSLPPLLWKRPLKLKWYFSHDRTSRRECAGRPTAVILHAKGRCSWQKEIKEVVYEKRGTRSSNVPSLSSTCTITMTPQRQTIREA